MSVRIIVGDCVERMKALQADSIHACVTDPPYHLTTGKKGGSGPASVNLNTPQGRARVTTGFMGMKWDGGDVAMRPETWAEVLRVLKPGAHLLAFSGTRTYHRMVCAIEDAGFEIRDQIGWLFGSGFPKSHNGEWGGTALKPAWEPIVLARKPLAGTVEANWKAHGTGALNIDPCRVEYAGTEDAAAAAAAAAAQRLMADDDTRERSAYRIDSGPHLAASLDDWNSKASLGRWPANLIHDGSEEVLAAFPEVPGQQGDLTGDEPSRPAKNVYGEFNERRVAEARGDAGSAARFFYCAKADRADRDDGLHWAPEVRQADREKADGVGGDNPRNRSNRSNRNYHPTVKPTELMRYLCRLVTPPGGTVLDPFMGSGSTGRGAFLEGFDFIGIEQDPAYAEIARERIRAIAPLLFAEVA